MNRENAKSLLPVIQAYAEGKTIQFKDGKGDWEDITGSIVFDCIPEAYRIKPEPRQGWVPTYAICASQEAATVLAKSMCGSPVGERCEIIPVIEVLK